MPRLAQADVRQKIMNAAEERLWHYGFKKTTIDEIASDAGVGKGTVYLYFDSKEDIALAIMAQFKIESLAQLEKISQSSHLDTQHKLKEMLSNPIVRAHARCLLSPSAQEMLIAVRPHIQARMQPYLEQEIALIANVLDEGNRLGILAVDDKIQTARTLKLMCSGFWPPYPCVDGIEAIKSEVAHIVDLAYHGLRRVNDPVSVPSL
jgi:AcrR family transcriptional regulator